MPERFTLEALSTAKLLEFRSASRHSCSARYLASTS